MSTSSNALRDQANGFRQLAAEWSKIPPDNITAMGYAAMAKQMCSLLRSTSGLLDSNATLLEEKDETIAVLIEKLNLKEEYLKDGGNGLPCRM